MLCQISIIVPKWRKDTKVLALHPHTCYIDSNYKPIGASSCGRSEVNLPGFYMTTLAHKQRKRRETESKGGDGGNGARSHRVTEIAAKTGQEESCRQRRKKEKEREMVSNRDTDISLIIYQSQWSIWAEISPLSFQLLAQI